MASVNQGLSCQGCDFKPEENQQRLLQLEAPSDLSFSIFTPPPPPLNPLQRCIHLDLTSGSL